MTKPAGRTTASLSLSTTRKLAALWMLVVLAIASYSAWLWLGQRVSPNTDILALLPSSKHDAVLQKAFSHMVDAAQQKVIVLVGDKDWNKAMQAAGAYEKAVTAPDLLTPMPSNAGELQAQWLSTFDASRTVLLTTEQQQKLQQAPAEQWRQQALAGMYGAFGGPKLGSWQDDPFGLFSGWVQERARETPVRPRDGHLFVEHDGLNYVLLIMELKPSAFSMAAQERVIPLLNHAKQSASALIPQGAIITGGVVLHAAAGSSQGSREMATIGTGSLVGVLLLMWLSFRSFKPILYIATSIAVGCLGAFAVCTALFGQVHLLTLVFGASLIGIAQDYGIYFLCSRLGADPATDSPTLLRQLLPSLFLMLAAAMIGYLGMALTPFPGLQQMAVFSALGLAFAWLTVACWFPAVVSPSTLRVTPLATKAIQSIDYWPALRATPRHLLILGVIAALIVAGLLRLQVSDDIRSLQKTPQALLDDQIKLGAILNMTAPVQFYLVRGASAEDVLQKEEQLRKSLQPLIDDHIITGVQAVSNWVPSLRSQSENRALIEKVLLSPQQGQPGVLAQVGKDIDESEQWSHDIADRIRAHAQPLLPDAFLASPAGETSRHLWLGQTGKEVASVVALRGLSDYRNLSRLAAVAPHIDGVQWVDKVQEISSVLTFYRRYMSWALFGAYAAVFGLLCLRYRSRAWRAIAPPLLATLATFAFFGWIGQPLQLFHVLAAMLVLGLGVDYGIFLLEPSHRARNFAWLTVSLSALSALFSFGLLALSGSPPLHAFGSTMLAGMLLVWVIVPCFMPEISAAHRNAATDQTRLP